MLQKLNGVFIVPLWNWNIKNERTCKLKIFSVYRTIVELKPAHMPDISQPLRVFIVPLWNWNRISKIWCTEAAKVFIVPLWNWNTYCSSSLNIRNGSVYRTIVELKHSQQCKCCQFCFGCLSYHCGIETGENKTGQTGCWWVFIVPLWNWNIPNHASTSTRKPGVYRTIVELKQSSLLQSPPRLPCVYRTIVELKLQRYYII